jgi:hypothetical protein
MEIAILVVLFLIGTVGAAVQALRYFERRYRPKGTVKRPHDDPAD